MRELISLQEDDSFGPGHFAAAAERRGVVIRSLVASRADRVPRDAPEGSGLLVLGGRLEARDLDACPYVLGWIDLIRNALQARRPVLAVGSGSVVLARALGAANRPGSPADLGWGTVTLTEAGLREPLFSGLPVYLPVYRAAEDVFELPAEALVLAASPSCPVEAFRWRETAYGLRFHVEATEGMVRAWRAERAGAAGSDEVFLDHEAVARRAGRLLENFLETCAAAT